MTILWFAGGLGSCLWLVQLMYNAVALFSYVRSKGDEHASGLAMGAWALGFVSFLLGPCAPVGGVVAMVVAAVERQRIFQDKSPFASAIPCRHASVNGTFTLLLWVTFVAGALGAWLQT